MINEHDIKDWDYIEVTTVKENPDGSADCNINLGPIALKHLLSFAFIVSLKGALTEGRLYTPEDTKA